MYFISLHEIFLRLASILGNVSKPRLSVSLDYLPTKGFSNKRCCIPQYLQLRGIMDIFVNATLD